MINNISLDFSELKNRTDIPVSKILSQYEAFPRRKRDTKKAHGFNTSPSKELSYKNFYVMTDYKSGTEVVEMPDGTKKRRPKYHMIFNSMDDAFKVAKCQRQVFTGLNHDRRDILVVDIDSSYSACFTEAERQQRIITIKSLCDSMGLFLPNYVEFHRDSGHCQLGWYLTEYFINYRQDKYISALYRSICKVMAKLLNADPAFTGGNIKNPYNENNIPYFFDKNPRNTEKLILQIKSAAQTFKVDTTFPNREEIEKYKVKKEKTEVDFDLEEVHLDDFEDDFTKFLESNSRNCYAFGHTRTWVFRYMREHNGQLPSEDSTISIFTEFEYRGAKLLKKDNIEPEANRKISALSILSFCKDQYSDEIAEQVKVAILTPKIQEDRRKSSIITRKAEKSLKVLKAAVLFSKGLTQKQIAKELSCTQPTVHNLLKFDLNKAIEELKDYLLFRRKSTTKKVRVFIDEIWSEFHLWGIAEKDIYGKEYFTDEIKKYKFTKILSEVSSENFEEEVFKNNYFNNYRYEVRGDPFIPLYY